MEHALASAVAIAIVLLFAALVVVWTRRRSWLRALAIPGALLGASISTVVRMVPMTFLPYMVFSP